MASVLALDFDLVATPRPLADVAKEFDLSPRQLWRYVGEFGITKYRMPGQGKRTYLDHDEVKRKLRARPVPPAEAR